MKISKSMRGKALIVRVEGWLDIESNREFADFMKGIPVQEELILDFSELEYISSSGIREIVALIHRQPEGTFSITGVNQNVMAVFEMIGLNEKVPITAK